MTAKPLDIDSSKHQWFLNGTYLGDFAGLPQASIETLKYVGEFAGVKVFESAAVPPGTLEYRNASNQRVAIIRGIGA